MLEKIIFNTKAAVMKKTSYFQEGDIILIPSNLTDTKKAKKAQIIQITDRLIVVEYMRSKLKESFLRVQMTDAKILISANDLSASK